MGVNLQSQVPFSPDVILTGTAIYGKPARDGFIDIGVNEKAFLFRVALPGVRNDGGELSIEIERNGKVHLQGVIKNQKPVYEMIVAQLTPPGAFNISFSLPGPVDPRLFSTICRSDGILEVLVIQCKERDVLPGGNQFDPAQAENLV